MRFERTRYIVDIFLRTGAGAIRSARDAVMVVLRDVPQIGRVAGQALREDLADLIRGDDR